MWVLLLEALAPLILEFGVEAVLQYLVDQGVFPAWVLGANNTAIESEPGLIEQLVQQTEVAVDSPAYGLQAIKTQVNRSAIDVGSILAAIDALSVQVSNLPVPPSAGSIAEQVWLVPPIEGEELPWNHLLYIENFCRNVGALAAFVLQTDPFLVVEAVWKYPPD
jgi:hypothetical protein